MMKITAFKKLVQLCLKGTELQIPLMLTLNTKDVTRERAIYFLIRGLLSKGKDIQSKISHLTMPTLGMLTMEFKGIAQETIHVLIRDRLKGKDTQSKISHLAMPTLGMLTMEFKGIAQEPIHVLIRDRLKGKDTQSKISHLAMPTLGMLTMEFKSTDLHELQLGTINSKTKDITLSEILSTLKRVMHILIKDHFCLKNKKTGSLLLKRNSTN
ncbi:uncharacterized protein isoform X11 [Leptinotarsa decemlineata]|uniref:uncharacterized protein isoform X11 n=1 Tax=Leptinotarsa decemlineata TaxID=7539 RepID=UPI003D30836A